MRCDAFFCPLLLWPLVNGLLVSNALHYVFVEVRA